MKRVKGQFKIRRVYQGLTVGKLPSPKLAKRFARNFKIEVPYTFYYICVYHKTSNESKH